MKLSLGQLFASALTAAALIAAIAFVLFHRAAQSAALQMAQTEHDGVASQVHQAVVSELDRAKHAIEHVERGIAVGAIPATGDADLEPHLLLELESDDHLAEVTFTRAKLLGWDDAGEARLEANGRHQVSVFRTTDGRVVTRVTKRGDGATYEASERTAPSPFAPAGAATDPTAHLTFSSLVAKRNHGRAIWSDLHFAEHDQAIEASKRRVVLTVQKAIEGRQGAFLGVLRIGLLMDELDELPRRILSDKNDPQTIALFAFSTGAPPRPALVGRLDPSDQIAVVGQDVRVMPSHPPPAIAALMASPLLEKLDANKPNGEGTFEVGHERYLATMRELETDEGGTSGWFVAVLGPEAHYTRDARRLERHLALGFAATLLVLLSIGALTLRSIRRGLEQLVDATNRMHAFDFAPSSMKTSIREIDQLGSGVERAKTVVRAMGKYIPMELVRRLFATNEEPKLGGVMAEISIMFTDIEGFTTLAEKLPPNELAVRLGEYLDAMTRAVDACEGTIDKYVGDAVMAIWNAPLPVERHAEKACRAALAAMKAASEVFVSESWKGLPPLVTRFGIHKATVMVGNFGATSRLSYTALGDGVNLAARLEPLCKQYGVVALVSEDVMAEAKSAFVFRHIDRVAVKGKTKGIDVYELLGAAGDDIPRLEHARVYEEAFHAYLGRDFARACELLAPQASADPPSRVLLDRCRDLEAHPPGDAFTGVFVAKSK